MREVYSMPFSHEEIFSGEAGEKIPYHRMYGKQYCVPALTVYTPDELDELHTAAEAVDAIYSKVMRFIQRYMPDSFLEHPLGIHPGLIAAARMEAVTGGITRQDWIIGEAGLKCIENNTDTPTGIPESAALEHILIGRTEDHTWTAPSVHMDARIRDCFRSWLTFYAEQGLEGPVTFTSYGDHVEDRTNTAYLMERCREAGYEVLYAPLEELEIVPGEALYHQGCEIRLLYRLYPLEYLIGDRDETTDVDIGAALIELVREGQLGLMNPVQHVLMQSKGFMAALWSLYERNEQTPEYCGFTLFDEAEMEVISRYLLPTYFTAEPFEQSDVPYVAKSYWGREGRGTILLDHQAVQDQADVVDTNANKNADTATNTQAHSLSNLKRELESDITGDIPVVLNRYDDEDEEVTAYYANQPKVYQQLVPMEQAVIQTEDGEYHGYVLTGVFVIGGRFAGMLPRVGEKVTGDMAYYCAAAVREPMNDEEEKEWKS
ncbi:glutathionylspermidine synthase family protein [Paenibacillus amylolyticus]|uniref:Glutathionylspermidine synthase family protein n=1 Tax=Paenibacillus amylolyticus TaxID=1451 RepID=A0A5M9WRK7_PAEAM|nr:glutathionylspermidine synthase family protein [Paenibacillus amylolyticus]KAA8784182.1 glutathionylspermidine synthase family protein [Paenibacillus amylolyticus]